jgi:23S rRNA (uracil1939-C5)-methyltransferase
VPLAELRIESIAAGGDGVARADGLVVFVPRTAPGDVALADVTPRGRFARGALRDLRVASAERVDPPCAHYTRDRCGGCQLQHLQYDAQLRAKARIIADALARIGGREGAAPAVRASPAAWRYRRKLTLALRRRGRRWIAGLHPYDDARAVFALADCPITDERVIAIWRDILAQGGHLPDARELRGAVRLDDGRAAFVLEGGTAWPGSASLFAGVPALSAIWWRPEHGTRRRLHARPPGPAAGASFVQVNPGAAAELEAHVLALVLGRRPATAVDGYAGLGDLAVRLASSGVRVAAVELDAEAAAWCASRLPAGSRAIAARVEDALPQLLPTDVVILNPPRAGVDARVANALEAAAPRPRAVVYVSCNPATLARDLRRMPSYRLASLAAFDLFPQTAHVETVCELVPEAA